MAAQYRDPRTGALVSHHPAVDRMIGLELAERVAARRDAESGRLSGALAEAESALADAESALAATTYAKRLAARDEACEARDAAREARSRHVITNPPAAPASKGIRAGWEREARAHGWTPGMAASDPPGLGGSS